MARKRKEIETYPFGSPGSLHVFTSKHVAEILEMEPWRLQKFVKSPQYNLSASDQLGYGIGSRRLFSHEDIFRLGLAAHLVADGFGYRYVAAAVQQIQDWDLIRIDDQGEERDPFPLIFLGDEKSLKVHAVRLGDSLESVMKRRNCSSFYFLDVPAILTRIHKRIAAMATQLKTKRGK